MLTGIHRQQRRLDLLALAAGALLPLAFAPVSWFALGLLLPALLFVLWRDASPGRAAWRGLLFGVGSFAVGVSWVYVSLRDYGGMPGVLAVLVVIAFVLLLSVFPAVAGWLQAQVGRGVPTAVRLAVVMPAAWTLAEWMRGWVLTGFPWLSLGYSQIQSPLVAVAPWAGVHGVTLAAAVVAGLLAATVEGSWPRRVGALALAAGILLAAQAGTAMRWSEPEGEPLRVALVQGNVALVDKWSPAHRERIIDLYLQRSRQHGDADLVVWPEAAIPVFVDELDADFWETLGSLGPDFLFGALERGSSERGPEYYNSVAAVSAGIQMYRKRHLVPFGEYVPLPRLTRPIMDYLVIPWSNLSPWQGPQAPIVVAGHSVGISICYEDAFPAEVLRALPAAALLVNVSEDAWFGDSLAPHQRLEMARMRARETERPMLRAANTGVSAIIDADGSVVARTEQFVDTVLTGSVQPNRGMTPYVRTGNLPVVALVAVVLVFSLGVSILRRRRVLPDTPG